MQQNTITPTQYRLVSGCLWFVILGGVGLLIFGVVFLREANASRSWPSVQGRVQNVSVVKNSSSGTQGSYHYVVTYAYQVDDQSYTGNRYSLGSGSTASKRYPGESEARTASRSDYPAGSMVDVYYDPADPASAVLNPGASWGTFGPLLMGLIFVPGGIFLLRAIRRNHKNSVHPAGMGWAHLFEEKF